MYPICNMSISQNPLTFGSQINQENSPVKRTVVFPCPTTHRALRRTWTTSQAIGWKAVKLSVELTNHSLTTPREKTESENKKEVEKITLVQGRHLPPYLNYASHITIWPDKQSQTNKQTIITLGSNLQLLNQIKMEGHCIRVGRQGHPRAQGERALKQHAQSATATP